VSAVLSQSEIELALQSLSGWTRRGNAIERVLELADFAAAMKLVNLIADAAEAANHHPDILINYNRVTLTLVSHDSGGVTQRDIRMAGKISEIVGA
jgi:4a-hydroxytetrahydrobiopterin dehydratase